MRILHYALGFPPYRSGGLTKYVMDLMQEQFRQGEEVIMLWPGAYGMFRHKTWIEQRKDVEGIRNFELRNPLMVPLLDGIRDISFYVKDRRTDAYYDFLQMIRPNVIHVHTLMGIHRDFFEAAFALKIPMVYTAHDYFPLCPKVTLFCGGKICNGIGDLCGNCNENALPFWKIVILQSKIYRRWKDRDIVRWLRSHHKKNRGINECVSIERMPNDSFKNYSDFFEYNKKCLSYMSCIHYGSVLTRSKYEEQGIDIPGCCIGLTHGGIKDRRSVRKAEEFVQFAFLAELLPYKGFGVLLNAMDELWSENLKNFRLHIYSGIQMKREYIIQHDPYQYADMGVAMQKVNMIIVPSLWYETYGLVVLEALSYGIPLLVSENVGAKELIGNSEKQKGIVIPPNKSALKTAIKHICETPAELERFSKNISEDIFEHEIGKHCRQIRQMYDRVQEEKEYEKQCGYNHTSL